MRTSLRTIAAVAAAGLLIAGCGDDGAESLAEKLAEDALGSDANVDVDINDDGEGTINVESSEGDMSMSFGDDLPEGFPGDLPLVEGTLLSGTRIEQSDDNEVIFGVTIQVDRTDLDELVAETRQALRDAGWEIVFENETDVGGQAIIGTQVENGAFMGSVNFLQDEDGSITAQYAIVEALA